MAPVYRYSQQKLQLYPSVMCLTPAAAVVRVLRQENVNIIPATSSEYHAQVSPGV